MKITNIICKSLWMNVCIKYKWKINNKCLKINIKNRVFYYFDNTINGTKINFSNILLNQKLYKNISVQSILCIYSNRSNTIELFLWYGWPRKDAKPYFQPGPLSEILTISNLRHAASRIWTCAQREFRLSWMKLCSSDNHCTTAYTTLHHCVLGSIK